MSHEVDPVIGKGVKLLLSVDEESSEELRSHLEEQIRLRYGGRRAQGVASLSPSEECNSSSSSLSGRRKHGGSGSDDPSGPPRKIPRTGDQSSSSSPTLNFDSGSSGGDSDDLPLEILEENLCVVCRGIQVSARNRFLECLDCHNLYHQNCASPPVEADVTDPRFVWYCESCRKSSNRVVSKQSQNNSSSSSSSCSISSILSVPSSPVSISNIVNIAPSSPVTSTSAPSKTSSSTASSSAKSSSSTRSGSQSTAFAVSNKTFGNKFRLFKSSKR